MEYSKATMAFIILNEYRSKRILVEQRVKTQYVGLPRPTAKATKAYEGRKAAIITNVLRSKEIHCIATDILCA